MDYLGLMMPHFGIPDLTESHPKLKQWWSYVKEREPFLTAFEQGRADLRAYRAEYDLPPLDLAPTVGVCKLPPKVIWEGRMEHTTIRGRNRYTSKKKEILDQDRGGETYIYTTHLDGSRVIRAHCSIDANSPRVLRDSIVTLNKNWTPRYGLVQITVDEECVSSSWFRFTDTMAGCEGFTVKEGRISQQMGLDVPPHSG